jgi:phosphatidate cytidylyltransferase
MLKQRLITGVIFVALLVGSTLFLSNLYFSCVLVLLALIGAWEWTALMGLSSLTARLGYVVLVALSLWAALKLSVVWIAIAACLGWLIALLWVLRFPKGRALRTHKGVGAVAGIVILVPTWLVLVTLHAEDASGPHLVLFLLAMTWVADTAAYFAGRRWGSLKLAPAISPGKTWEGVGGAALAVVLYAAAGNWLLLNGRMPGIFVLLCLLTLLFSILGDLLESLFKREAGVKDSGTILPGHGGLLDRIDSLTAAAPIFMLGLILSGIMP